ncbi:TdeIII family type II restriction endonuclease [Candidatus Shapirobacteria bacterium]|nr:TdeIII family type II restriction endonuclease [Candidatus Shapirobacteria bacterium]
MQNNKIKKLIKASVLDLLANTTSEKKISQIVAKHAAKVHFVPTTYRIFGGLLQSLNIQFGNFIEVLMQRIIAEEKRLKIVEEISGKKNVILSLTEETDSLIDRFISDRQNNNDSKLSKKFEQLLKNIVAYQQSDKNLITMKHDVDVLFQDKNGIYYYVELKYNDDHDTGKFVDINRKFLKTYAGLVKKLGIKDTKKLKPILYYFNRKIMKGNIYVPEETYIYRGEKLFKEFLTMKYKDVDGYLKNVSEDKEILEIFDNLYKKIRYGK